MQWLLMLILPTYVANTAPDLPLPPIHLSLYHIALPKTTLYWASYYGEEFHGKLMSNQKPFDMYAMTLASKTIPNGTRLRLCADNGKCAKATVTDSGPYVKGIDFDVSLAVAAKLNKIKQGVFQVTIEYL